MDCHDAKDRILEERETAAVRRHVERCADCREFTRELAAGGRELARALRAEGPRPGFHARIAARIAEEEIAARPQPASLGVRLVAVGLFLGLVAAGTLVFRGARSEPSAAERDEAVLTPVGHEYPLRIAAVRGRAEGPTVVSLGFAGETRALPLSADVEGEVLRAWRLGARRVVLDVTRDVPFCEVSRILEILEWTGFAYDLRRPKG